MTDRDKMLAGEPYDPSAPDLVDDRERCTLALQRFQAAGSAAERREFLGQIVGSLGDGAVIEAPLHCDYGWNIHLGTDAFVNYGAMFVDCAPITLGNAAQVGPGVQLLTAVHPLDAVERRSGVERAAAVVVGENAWLGGGVVVLPGVTIGRDAVVGAASVVTRDVPDGVLAVGNPCRVVRAL